MEDYVKPEIINLKNHPELNEKWVQKKISEDTSLLGLGDLTLKDSERNQPSGGRLDLLFYDPEINRRYEVEIQLGKTDESHIIRTIEYWDWERRRFPQYEHCAVLVAEDVTSRFLNVISLFNGNIPIIAIQMKAIKIGTNISLFFTTVVDELEFGREEIDEEKEKVDRTIWEEKGSKESLSLADEILKLISDFAPGFSLNYLKHYIGVSKDEISQNFISFVPRKKDVVILHAKHEQDTEIDNLLDSSELDALSYDRRFKQYRLRLKKIDINNNKEILRNLIKKSFESYMK